MRPAGWRRLLQTRSCRPYRTPSRSTQTVPCPRRRPVRQRQAKHQLDNNLDHLRNRCRGHIPQTLVIAAVSAWSYSRKDRRRDCEHAVPCAGVICDIDIHLAQQQNQCRSHQSKKSGTVSSPTAAEAAGYLLPCRGRLFSDHLLRLRPEDPLSRRNRSS